MKPKEKVTIALPTEYISGDFDQDGQISFFEWKQWKRGDLLGFQALDHDRDGFLIPAELRKGPMSGLGGSPSSSSLAAGAERSPTAGIVPSGRSFSGGSGSGSGSGSNSGSGRSAFRGGRTESVSMTAPAPNTTPEALRNRGESMFRLIDTDKDGSISSEEWGKASKLRGRFEGAGADLSKAMPREEFLGQFVQLPPES